MLEFEIMHIFQTPFGIGFLTNTIKVMGAVNAHKVIAQYRQFKNPATKIIAKCGMKEKEL